jgi:hypothetical protein
MQQWKFQVLSVLVNEAVSYQDKKMSMVDWYNNADREKTRVRIKKPIQLPFYPPQISHGLVWD